MRAAHFTKLFLLTLLAWGAAACAPAAQAEPLLPAELPQPVVQTQAIPPTATPALPQATATPEQAAIGTPLPFSAATYRDEAGAFELDYPSAWTVQPRSQIGERGSQALLLSPGTTPETLAEGGSRIAMVLYKWDPRKNLAAYLTQRKTAWTSSGSSILSETSWELADGSQAVNLVVQGPDKAEAFVLLTTSGEDYLQISGEGNLTLVEEIARTLRPMPAKP